MSAGQTSVVVVEIDTRKGPVKTVFESSIQNQSEQAKQFWKTLNLSPHIESSLYSKEILQQIKTNPLRPTAINNTRKYPQADPKTEAYLDNIRVLNQIDEIMKIQKKAARIESIKQIKQKQKEKSNQLTYVSRTALMKSESESHWIAQLNDANDKLNYNEKINEDEYEIDAKDFTDEDLVKNLQ